MKQYHIGVNFDTNEDCQPATQLMEDTAKEESSEAENIILLITFLLLVCLVYITGLIVWVWCNRNPKDGLNAVQQTDRVALRPSSMRWGGLNSILNLHILLELIYNNY